MAHTVLFVRLGLVHEQPSEQEDQGGNGAEEERAAPYCTKVGLTEDPVED